MIFVAEGSERAVRIARVLCGRINRTLGAHPYRRPRHRLPQLPGRRATQRKIGPSSGGSGGSGCLSCFWVGFPPAPRYQLLAPTALLLSPLSTTFVHILPVSH